MSPRATLTTTNTNTKMTTYQIHYNKSIFNAIDIEEAEQIAKSLIEPSMPFKARIIAVDENEDFIQTIKTITI
jgi:hypothetical protein